MFININGRGLAHKDSEGTKILLGTWTIHHSCQFMAKIQYPENVHEGELKYYGLIRLVE